MSGHNGNLLQSMIVTEQLVQLGVETVCIASGSRSTPLTLAFTSHPNITCYAFVDERGAAFFALGRAKLTNRPVVVISTSGTAGANFYPAIIEAKESGIPLIIMTADRPHELRISGANQTTDQIKIFGDFVNWFTDVVSPQSTENMTEYCQYLATQAFQHSVHPISGPVHLNFPFRKPLEPQSQESIIETLKFVGTLSNWKKFAHGKLVAEKMLQNQFENMVMGSQRFMVILGPDAYRDIEQKDLKKLLKSKSGIILADALSGLRYMSNRISTQLHCYENYLSANILEHPDLIVQFGEMPISKNLDIFLSKYESEWIICNSRGKMTDSTLKSTQLYAVAPKLLINQLKSVYQNEDEKWINTWMRVEEITEMHLQKELRHKWDFEPSLLATMIHCIRPQRVWVANSLIVRYFDQFLTKQTNLQISSNRGVSGIDGTLSTAIGTSSVEPTLLITGDLAFYHDMNALLTLQRYNLPLKIIIINNQGGAIFDRLPISNFEPPFQEFFINKHNLSFNLIAKQFNLPHYLIQIKDLTQEQFQERVSEFRDTETGILEIKTEYQDIERVRLSIKKAILKVITELK